MLTAKSHTNDNRTKIHLCPSVSLKPFLALFLAALAFSLAVAPCAAQNLNKSEAKLRVMSYNAYEGADLGPAMTVTTYPELFAAVGAILANVQATNPPARMAAVASQIGKAQPTLVGLQEVTEWRTCPTSDFQTCAAPPTVLYDLLNLLKGSLAAQGFSYNEVVHVDVNELAAPTITGNGPILVLYTQRNAILARSDIDPSNLQLSGVQYAKFTADLPVPSPIIPVTVHRAWASVDVNFYGTSFRFIDTHLDSFHPGVNFLQAEELLSGPVATTTLPVVVVMDSNSPANLPSDPFYGTYADFQGHGFQDAWTEANPGVPGLTCCQAGTLTNMPSAVYQRVDLVLIHGDLNAMSALLYGGKPSDRTMGLWPSDHVGVAARLDTGD